FASCSDAVSSPLFVVVLSPGVSGGRLSNSVMTPLSVSARCCGAGFWVRGFTGSGFDCANRVAGGNERIRINITLSFWCMQYLPNGIDITFNALVKWSKY